MELIIIAGLFLLLARRPAAGDQQINPTSYTQSPNSILQGALNMGGALSVPLISSALNGMGRPLGGGFGLTIGGQQSDPNYGDPGASQQTLGLDTSPGTNPGADLRVSMQPTSFELGGGGDDMQGSNDMAGDFTGGMV